MHPIVELEGRYCAHNYASLPIVLTKADGCYVWDDQGNRYLDMLSAYSAVSFGHAHPRLLAALTAQAGRLALVSRAFHTDRLAPFVARACELTGMDQGLPMNTGAEAVETAIKASRKWAYQVKGVPSDHAQIIVCDGNFHGRTTTIVGFSSEPQYQRGFGPFSAGFVRIPFGHAEALERAITPYTAAFLIEPIQGEGGIIVPPDGYLARCAEICRGHNVLLLCDEVQTGLGRTGRVLACDHEQVKPDGLMLGKALGGGLLPVSMFLAKRELMDVFGPGDHGSTFGGNPLAAAVGLEALNVLVDEHLAERAAELGDHWTAGLRAIGSPLILDVRGKGLLSGVEIDTRLVSGRTLSAALATNGILSKETHEAVIRFAPPLVITRPQLDWALERIKRTLGQFESPPLRRVAAS